MRFFRKRSPGAQAPSSRRASSGATQWAVMILGLLAMGGLLGVNLYQEREETESRAQERLLSLARIVDDITSHNLSAINSVLETLCREQEAGPPPEDQLNRRLTALADALTGVRTLLVVDAKGVIRAANRPELLGVDAGNREYFQAASRDPVLGRLYVTPPFKTVLDLRVIALARVIPGPEGRFAGVVVAGLDPDFFAPLLRSVLFTSGMWSALAHGDGGLFLMEPERPDVEGKDLAQPGSFFTRHRDGGRKDSVFSGKVYATGEERMLAARTIRPPGLDMDKPLFVAVTRDLNDIFELWRKGARTEMGAFLMAALGACAGLAYYRKRQERAELALAESIRRLQERERFIRTVTDGVPSMVAYWNKGLDCEYANLAYQEWFGRSQAEMRGIGIRELLGEKLYAKNEPYILGALRGEPQRFERTLVRADGTVGYTLVRYIPDEEGGQVRGFIVLVTDVTELKSTQLDLEEKVLELDKLATTDHLTGIANRRHFLERAEEELRRAERYDLPMAFLMLDIDLFKKINDTYGHHAGDEVLRTLGDTIRRATRTSDIYGRLGGEEFGVMLVQTGFDDGLATAERLRTAVENVCVLSRNTSLCYTVSVGLAAFRRGETLESIMKRADAALFEAKRAGRNRVCRADGDQGGGGDC